jgi:uncharacterized protein
MPLPPPAPGRVAVVTGASGGIGADIARELARRGHELVLVARTDDRLTALAGELSDRHGTVSHVIPVDLADRAARDGLPDELDSRELVCDVLVNNAGFSTTGPVHASDPAREQDLVEVDVVTVVDLCSRLLPGMVQRGRGAVLNVASTAAFQPLPGQAAYGAAKAFVLSYTRSLSGELRGTGVNVTVLCPGPVDTGFGEAAGFTKEEADNALPKVMWLPAEEVARQAVDGLDKGTLVVIPGWVNRLGAGFSTLVPKRLLIPILAKNHPALR